MSPPGLLGRQAQQLVKDLVYVVCGIPLGAIYVALLATGVSLGLSLAVLWIGLPLLLITVALVWHGADLERQLANRLLEAHISPLPRPVTGPFSQPLAALRQRLGERAFWRAGALLALRLPTAVAGTVVVAVGGYIAVALVIDGTGAVLGDQTGYFGRFRLSPGLGVLLCLLALPVSVLTIAFTDYAARSQRWLVRTLLLRSLPAGAPVRETLAQSLGDRSLSIAYWLADRGVFVDERGQPVPLPRPGSGRA